MFPQSKKVKTSHQEYACDKCPMSFSTAQARRNHMRIHNARSEEPAAAAIIMEEVNVESVEKSTSTDEGKIHIIYYTILL